MLRQEQQMGREELPKESRQHYKRRPPRRPENISGIQRAPMMAGERK